jgi:uncharacterized protein YggT (Ycf19 family)
MATTTPRSETRPGIARQIRDGLAPILGASNATLRALYTRIALLTRLAFAVVLALVGVRILFKVTGANETASFVRFVYRVSGVVVEPFHSIFADRTVNQHPFEISSLVAIGVWAAAGFVFVRVVRILVAAGK